MSSDGGTPARTPRRALVLAGAAALVVLVLAVAVVLAYRAGAGSTAAPTASATPRPTATAPSTAQVYRKLRPSVVVVTTADGALGSGVVAAANGTILTAYHVVADGSAVTVTFADGSSTRALIGTADVATDIAALIPISPTTIVPADLGGAAAVGAPVIAMGAPEGLSESITTGVVSGLDRRATTPRGQVTGLIQFDAAVNPGSSGGPLLDGQGSVVGIVVALLNPAGDDSFAGIGFAVPIGTALGATGGGEGGGPQK